MVFKHGQRLNTPYLTLLVLKNESQHGQHGRVAFIAGKKQGNAVWRNSAKRRLRSLCRDMKGPFPGYDVVFLAKQHIKDVPYRQVKEKLSKVVGQIQVGL